MNMAYIRGGVSDKEFAFKLSIWIHSSVINCWHGSSQLLPSPGLYVRTSVLGGAANLEHVAHERDAG